MLAVRLLDISTIRLQIGYEQTQNTGSSRQPLVNGPILCLKGNTVLLLKRLRY